MTSVTPNCSFNFSNVRFGRPFVKMSASISSALQYLTQIDLYYYDLLLLLLLILRIFTIAGEFTTMYLITILKIIRIKELKGIKKVLYDLYLNVGTVIKNSRRARKEAAAVCIALLCIWA